MNKLKPCQILFANEGWIYFEEVLKNLIENETTSILNSSDFNNILVSQGKIKAYKQLLSLPEELRKQKTK